MCLAYSSILFSSSSCFHLSFTISPLSSPFYYSLIFLFFLNIIYSPATLSPRHSSQPHKGPTGSDLLMVVSSSSSLSRQPSILYSPFEIPKTLIFYLLKTNCILASFLATTWDWSQSTLLLFSFYKENCRYSGSALISVWAFYYLINYCVHLIYCALF